VDQTRIGFGVNFDYDRIGHMSEKQAFGALADRLLHEDGLDIEIEGQELHFRNPWTWNITQWTPFSVVDSGSLTVKDTGGAIAVRIEVSYLRAVLISLAAILFVFIVLALTGSSLRVGLAMIFPMLCFLPALFIGGSAILFVTLIFRTLRNQS
jgi:hypothetical protein